MSYAHVLCLQLNICYTSNMRLDHHLHFDFVVDMSVIPLTSLCFALTEPRQKTLDLETSCQMLELVLGQRPLVLSFIQFLEVLNLFIGSL